MKWAGPTAIAAGVAIALQPRDAKSGDAVDVGFHAIVRPAGYTATMTTGTKLQGTTRIGPQPLQFSARPEDHMHQAHLACQSNVSDRLSLINRPGIALRYDTPGAFAQVEAAETGRMILAFPLLPAKAPVS